MTGPAFALPPIWREFARFVRRPLRLDPVGLRSRQALREWIWLAGLLIAVMGAVMLPLITLWQAQFNLPPPDAFGKIASLWLVPLVVMLAPASEELLFRGWLSGRPRALWLLGCALGEAGLLYASSHGASALGCALAMLALLVAAPVGWFVLRKRSAPGWFDRTFPAIFYAVTLLFAALHLTNYPQISAIALPLVLPQLWAGLVLGFARVRFGLIPAILIHALSNSATLALALLG